MLLDAFHDSVPTINRIFDTKLYITNQTIWQPFGNTHSNLKTGTAVLVELAKHTTCYYCVSKVRQKDRRGNCDSTERFNNLKCKVLTTCR